MVEARRRGFLVTAGRGGRGEGVAARRRGSTARRSGARGRRRRGQGRGGSGGVVETADTEALPWRFGVAVALHGEASCGGGKRGRGGREQWSAAAAAVVLIGLQARVPEGTGDPRRPCEGRDTRRASLSSWYGRRGRGWDGRGAGARGRAAAASRGRSEEQARVAARVRRGAGGWAGRDRRVGRGGRGMDGPAGAGVGRGFSWASAGGRGLAAGRGGKAEWAREATCSAAGLRGGWAGGKREEERRDGPRVGRKGGCWPKRKEEDFPIMTKGFLDGTKRDSRGSLKRGFEK